VHDLAPGPTLRLLALVNRLLPAPGGIAASAPRGGRTSASVFG
jgi:hypothetical protein